MGRIFEDPRRKGSLYVQWRDGQGRRRTRRVRCSHREAERILRKRETEAERERHGVPTPQAAAVASLDVLIEGFKAQVQTYRSPETWKHYEVGIGQVLGFLKGRHKRLRCAADVTLDDLNAFAAARQKAGAAANTINGRIGAVRALFNWGVRVGKLAASPIARWRKMKGPKRRQRRALTAVEIGQLLRHSPPELADIWRFFLGTGVRAGELTGLAWDDVDWQGMAVAVRAATSKSKRERTIPLREDLIPVLRRQRQRRAAQPKVDGCEELVFANSWGRHWKKRLSVRLKPCLAAASLPKAVDVHCMRHTFGSHLIANGFDVKTVAELMGHSSPMVTLEIYSHELGVGRRREAVASLPLPEVDSVARPARQVRADARVG